MSHSSGLFAVLNRKNAGGAADPSFVKEHDRVSITNNVATTALTIASNVPTGNMIALTISCGNAVTSIADSSGNTYAENVTHSGVGKPIKIWSAPITSALSTSDTVTITWTSPSNSDRMISMMELADCDTFDIGATGGPDSTTNASATATTTAATVLVGMSVSDASGHTASGNNSNVVGAKFSTNTEAWAFEHVSSSGASTTSGITRSAPKNNIRAWAAYK